MFVLLNSLGIVLSYDASDVEADNSIYASFASVYVRSPVSPNDSFEVFPVSFHLSKSE